MAVFSVSRKNSSIRNFYEVIFFGSQYFKGVCILLLIILSAFFSSVETAFSTVNTIRLRHDAENGSKRAKTALTITENYDKALTTILIGNNIVNIGCSSIATVLCLNLFGDMGAAISTGRRYDTCFDLWGNFA